MPKISSSIWNLHKVEVSVDIGGVVDVSLATKKEEQPYNNLAFARNNPLLNKWRSTVATCARYTLGWSGVTIFKALNHVADCQIMYTKRLVRQKMQKRARKPNRMVRDFSRKVPEMGTKRLTLGDSAMNLQDGDQGKTRPFQAIKTQCQGLPPNKINGAADIIAFFFKNRISWSWTGSERGLINHDGGHEICESWRLMAIQHEDQGSERLVVIWRKIIFSTMLFSFSKSNLH